MLNHYFCVLRCNKCNDKRKTFWNGSNNNCKRRCCDCKYILYKFHRLHVKPCATKDTAENVYCDNNQSCDCAELTDTRAKIVKLHLQRCFLLFNVLHCRNRLAVDRINTDFCYKHFAFTVKDYRSGKKAVLVNVIISCDGFFILINKTINYRFLTRL